MKNCNCIYKNSCMIPDYVGCSENTFKPDWLTVDTKTAKIINEIVFEYKQVIVQIDKDKKELFEALSNALGITEGNLSTMEYALDVYNKFKGEIK